MLGMFMKLYVRAAGSKSKVVSGYTPKNNCDEK